MCCDNKCMFFIKVRTGSLIFGYLTAFLSGFGVLACVGTLLYFATCLVVCSYGPAFQPFVFLTMFFFYFTAEFTCTVILLFGINENKPVLVKTYVIFGMINLGLLLSVTIILFCTCLPVFGVLAFLACGVYTLLVYMVYLTYKGMTNIERNDITNPPNLLMA